MTTTISEKTRLLEIMGENKFSDISLLKQNSDWLALARMGVIPKQERIYVFEAPDATHGVDIVVKEEKLLVTPKGVMITSRATEKFILRRHDFWIKQNQSQPQRKNLQHLQHCYNNQLYHKYVKQVYPHLESLLKGDIQGYTALVSVNRVCKHKLYSVEKILKFQYKHLWLSVSKILVVKGGHGGWTEQMVKDLNGIARVNPEVNDCLLKIYSIDKRPAVSAFQFHMDSYKICKAYLHPFKFTWSEKRMRDVHDKLNVKYVKALCEHDPKPLHVHPSFRHDYQQTADFVQDFRVVLITDSGHLAAEGQRMNHCVATYANTVNSGNCCILSIDLGTEHATMQVQTPFYPKKDEMLQLRNSQLTGPRNAPVSAEMKRACEYLLAEINEKSALTEYTYEKAKQAFPDYLMRKDSHQIEDLPF